jgi:hypothetical protein
MNMAKDDRWLRGWLVGSVILHFAVAMWHGMAHMHVPVPLTALQTVFVWAVILAMPFVGICLLWTRGARVGAWVIAVAMLASLVFGVLNHFVLDSPDYVMHVPEHAWRHAFVLSAALVTEAVGTVLGVVAAVRWSSSRAEEQGNR